MADKEEAEGGAEASEEAVAAPKGKLKLIIAVVLVLAIVGGGSTWFFFLRHHGEVVCDLPLAPLVEDAPNYDRSWSEPVRQPHLDPRHVPPPTDWESAVLRVIACPDVASKRWIWEQYDSHVMADTLEDSATGAVMLISAPVVLAPVM